MKILHTADWHLGKQLYKKDLSQEMSMFLQWLLDLITSEHIELILISGDIFDTTNPTNEARKQYYKFLAELSRLNVKVIITSGNHDSVTHLGAAKELLAELNIRVVHDIDNDIKNSITKVDRPDFTLFIAAIPYLRDRHLRGEMKETADRVEAVKKSIHNYYSIASKEINKQRAELEKPTYSIAMGHMFVQGSKVSDSEREIQVGNLAGLSGETLAPLFDYMALGHIHRPQKFCDGKVRYSGSPISLSFSERTDNKSVEIVEIEDKLTVNSIPVPQFRKLIKLEGSLSEITIKIGKIQSQEYLPAYIEIHVIEESESSISLQHIQSKLSELTLSSNYEILKERISYQSKIKGLYDLDLNRDLEDSNPIDIFQSRLDQEPLNEDQRRWCIEQFRQILEEVNT